MLRLGDVVAREGRLSEESIDAAIDTVRRFRTIADVQHCDEIVAMATAAMRQAANGPEAAERIEAATGVRIQVVSGIREAQLVFDAVRASVLIDPGPALCADLGGGSLELSVGDRFGLSYATSLHLGVGRLTTEFVRTDPPSKKDRARLKEHISRLLDEVLEDILACGPKVLIGTSGTLCALARGAAARRDGVVPYSVNQLTVSARELAALGEMVYELASLERGRLPGIDARRGAAPSWRSRGRGAHGGNGLAGADRIGMGPSRGDHHLDDRQARPRRAERRPPGDPACLGHVALRALALARKPLAPGRSPRPRDLRLDACPARAGRGGQGAARAGRALARHRRAREP